MDEGRLGRTLRAAELHRDNFSNATDLNQRINNVLIVRPPIYLPWLIIPWVALPSLHQALNPVAVSAPTPATAAHLGSNVSPQLSTLTGGSTLFQVIITHVR